MRFPLLLALALLAGCIGSCPAQDSAAFHAPGLYGELDEAATRAGTEVTLATPPAGLPLASEALADRWGSYAVTFVDYREGGRTARLSGLSGSPTLDLVIPGAEGPEGARAFFRAVLANTSQADEATRKGWEDALVASRRDLASMGTGGQPAPAPPADPGEGGDFYQVRVAGPFALEQAFALAGGAASLTQRGSLGFALAQGGGWEIGFTIPARSIEVDGVRIEADAEGAARVTAARQPGETDAVGSAARVDQAFERLGLAPPRLQAHAFATVVC